MLLAERQRRGHAFPDRIIEDPHRSLLHPAKARTLQPRRVTGIAPRASPSAPFRPYSAGKPYSCLPVSEREKTEGGGAVGWSSERAYGAPASAAMGMDESDYN